MAYKLDQNNFDKFKNDFKKDTGYEWNASMAATTAYINYYAARVSDNNMQANFNVVSLLDSMAKMLAGVTPYDNLSEIKKDLKELLKIANSKK
jgi:hypothetical protein